MDPQPGQPPAGRQRRAAAQFVESLAATGITHAGRRRSTPQPKSEPESEPAAQARILSPNVESPPILSPIAAAAGVSAQKPKPVEISAPGIVAQLGRWNDLRLEVAACTACSELAATRKQTVFGVGNLRPRLCFLGEAPGADEDQQGEPFVGAAGKLLTKIIEASRLTRGEVYILNILKCRPPGNRTPAPDEVANCRGFLERQLALLQPEFICCLGAVAAQSLLQTTTPIGRLRGRLHQQGDWKVLCTYHPAYLLRNPAAKADVWQDMKMLMREMGTPVD